MGFELNVVVSSPVVQRTRNGILESAALRWPHTRRPRDAGAYPNRAIFAPPELTSYLYRQTADWDEAFSQNCHVREELVPWSRDFPNVDFAFIEANCFGGSCVYDGFSCRAGRVTLKAGALSELLHAVGIELETLHFAPFVRGYFTGRGSGGFK